MSEKKQTPGQISSGRKFWRVCRFRRDESGVTAVEFGMVALPFLVLLFAILEVSLSFFSIMMVENAVETASRLVKTGQAQTAGFSETQFKQQICDKVFILPNCNTELRLDVRTYNSFGDITLDSPVDADGEFTEDYNFDMGSADQIIVVRAFYKWDLMNRIPGLGISNLSDGSLLIDASAAFKNEPF